MKPFPSGRPPLALPARAAFLLAGALLGACSSSQPHAHGPSVPLAPGRPPGAVALDPAEGQAIGFTYEAFLNPQQEPGEERDTQGVATAVSDGLTISRTAIAPDDVARAVLFLLSSEATATTDRQSSSDNRDCRLTDTS